MDIQKTLDTFKALGFETAFFQTGAEATAYIAAQCADKTVGIGGSKTVEGIGLYDELLKKSTVYWHWITPGNETRQKAAAAQVYITSANAVSQTGEIINIDGNGNRVGASMFGHDKVFYVVGVNKLCEDFETALYRARNVAAPLNARRFNRKTPCVMSDVMRCYDCHSPERICNGFSILRCPMRGNHSTELVLINETLGY